MGVTPAAAITSSFSGKTMALFADNPTSVQGGVFTATIVKGKKKNVLVIETTATVFGGGTFACINAVTVNGLQANPTTGAFNITCTPTTAASSQTVSTTYWFDIDNGETRSPGTFYGQPLNVVVTTGTNVPGLAGGVSVVVRMERK